LFGLAKVVVVMTVAFGEVENIFLIHQGSKK
jgi:hypothetical protein